VPNALAHETSPYLRQHSENPVDWLPWGPRALRRAREEDRPLLVSIGYSSCHWCHVMERESFEDERTAALMNEGFVCVKVDREERPDVDAIYMEAVVAMTGHGGWPLNVFLTPEGVPFFGGTYFPPQERAGMASWTQVLQAVAAAWTERREEIRASGARTAEALAGAARLEPAGAPLEEHALERAVAGLAERFDAAQGGFGGAPKFPQAPVLGFLLARAGAGGEASERARAMALVTLRAMARGGIRDQLGGGFHRYAVDAAWRVPHFEKMLYDNALLARCYLRAHELTGEEALAEVCRTTLDWALREMRGAEGGFHAALDADSDGVEGAFYVWTQDEVREALGADADERGAADAQAALSWLGVTAEGNFADPHHPAPGLNVLCALGEEPTAEQRERIRERLLATRAQRERPGLDDKRIASWNALMIAALAEAGQALGEERYTSAARACADFVLSRMRDGEGRLLRTYAGGEARLDAYLEDHAFLLEALIALFEATCEERYLEEARALADTLIARFGDSERGGFYSTASDAEALIARRKEIEDNPIPSGQSSAAAGLARLAELTGEEAYVRHADAALALVRELAPRHPQAFGHALEAMHWRLAPVRPIACPLPGAAPAARARHAD
jgi:uncharacterized protein YyaL (SSP411 family)